MASRGIDWSKIDPATIDFVLGQAEKHLQAQFQSATASDARAITAASIFAGLAGVIITGVVGYVAISWDAPTFLGGMSLMLTMLAGAYFCFLAGRPVDFFVPGNQPVEWYSCLAAPLSQAKGVEIENYQSKIEDNEAALDIAATNLMKGMRLGGAAPIVGAAIYGVTWYFS